MTRSERLIRKLAEGTELADYLAAHQEAVILVMEVDRKRKRKAARSLPRRKAEAVTRRLDREASADLRSQVATHALWICERCGSPRMLGEGHAHHLYGGNGRRRAMESVDTMAWLCATCHAHVHANPMDNKALRILIREKRARTGER